MSTKEAAEYLEVDTITILRLIKRGILSAEKFGNYWVLDPGSVEEYAKFIEGKSKNDPTRSRVD